MRKSVIITGCLGFIGYHMTRACLDLGWHVRGIDKITYAANVDLLPQLRKYDNFVFEQIDINDIAYLKDCDYIINTAAETHVDNSIVSSTVFVRSNIDGVHRILELVKTAQGKKPMLIHFSTDEVYGDIAQGFHSECDLLKPSNPYSATKASADMLILAWARTYKVPYVIVRPTNNFGIGQYSEKFIPNSIKRLCQGQPVQLHDLGTPIRTWLHVNDTVKAVLTIIKSGRTNEIFNISGNREFANKTVALKILHHMNLLPDENKYLDLSIKRPGQDVRYAIDDTKLQSLGWQATADFDKELKNIVYWYREHS
jgi:dTDP-glucose 4,6-dehydratase